MEKRTQPRIWTTKTYNRLSHAYDTFMKIIFPLGEKGRQRIVDKLLSGRILDVACGTGTLLKMANQKGLQCYGMDISEGMLVEAVRKIVNAEIMQASYYQIPYAEASFDYVVATNALSGVYIDAEKVLSEMFRVCKPGGEIYIAEWPKSQQDDLMERLVVWLASLSDDAPKDYDEIFTKLGYKPEIDLLDKRYCVYGIRK